MKIITDYENYSITETGEVFNNITQKYLKGSIGENGYRYYRLSNNYRKKKMFYAHRLVAEAYLENPNNLPVVNHLDGNKLNNNVNNLEWISYSNNTRHWHNNNKQFRKEIEYYTNDLPNEEWKEYSNYLFSSYGRVRHKVKNNLLTPSITCGYYKVRLSNQGLVEDVFIHKKVFELFSSEDLLNNMVIDHKDGNKLNNCITNLCQISKSDNVKKAYYEQKTNKNIKRVGLFNLDNEFILEFVSVSLAARELNLDSSTISKVCRGINKTHGGFKFKYLD